MAEIITDSLSNLKISMDSDSYNKETESKNSSQNETKPMSYSEKLNATTEIPEPSHELQNVSSHKENQTLGNDKKYKILVLDTNPLLRGENLSSLSERFVTIPEVIGEIVSKQARDRLEFVKLSLNLELIEPDSESISAVIKKSKETGDFNFLSITDIKVISLALMLSKQYDSEYADINSSQNKTPSEPSIGLEISPNITPISNLNPDQIASQEIFSSNSILKNEDLNNSRKFSTQSANKSNSEYENDEVIRRVDQHFLSTAEFIKDSEYEEIFNEPAVTDNSLNTQSDPTTQENNKDDITSKLPIEKVPSESNNDIAVEEQEEEDSDEWSVVKKPKKKINHKKKYKNVFGWGGEWITPENINHAKVLDASGVRDIGSGLKQRNIGESSHQLIVGSVTSDFAMQNVILGMGLGLVSVDGFVIKELKTWVLRCHSCFETTPKMDIQFCPSCGHPTLIRASVSSQRTRDDSIIKKVHLKKNFKYNLQGTRYSIPSAVGGKSGTDIITRADDKRYLDSMARRNLLVSKMERQQLKGDGGLWDVGYVPNMLIGAGDGTKARNGERFDARGMPVIGFGRKNPNRSKKTGNRKK
ncbi:20S-pre-rRNA D-site endonuclease nob1 [Smittium mucronatum]|uniref:20S-pre-rRNA D-site endonuclease NOB1 n=1 Tax=Smittium mucronatum TaxID=133383 RepID=A0A1R0GZW7_9FUNG|nr:20S-pre-rRNA D-site endonuclease nob1 [Smittium mucronatum]